MTATEWLILGAALLGCLVLAAAFALFAWRQLARYVNFVLETPKWLVVVAFVLFPPAFFAYLIGLIPYSQAIARADKEFSDGLMEYVWEKFPPSAQIKGDESTRRVIAAKRRALGYDLEKIQKGG